jgi:Protein of unknown function (DUF3574)
MTKMSRLLIAILLLSTSVLSQAAKKYHKVELYFGLSERGKPISEQQWQSFVDNYITPSFPEGMTIIDAYGQWRDDSTHEITKEKSKMVVLICPKHSEATRRSVEGVKKKYCDLYNQQSVMEVDTKTEKVSF